MELAQRIDDYGKPAWIALTIFAFIVFWPIGLALLAYLIWSGRMGCRSMKSAGRWHYYDEARKASSRGWSRSGKRSRSSGNTAFDEYREQTLRRLEQEQDDFQDYLDRLRQAKDKAEFDAFMAEQEAKARQAKDEDGPIIDNGDDKGAEDRPQA